MAVTAVLIFLIFTESVLCSTRLEVHCVPLKRYIGVLTLDPCEYEVLFLGNRDFVDSQAKVNSCYIWVSLTPLTDTIYEGN